VSEPHAGSDVAGKFIVDVKCFAVFFRIEGKMFIDSITNMN